MSDGIQEALKWLIPIGILAIPVSVEFFSRNSVGLKPYRPKKPDRDPKIRATENARAWAEVNGFDFLGFYTVRYGTAKFFMAAWQLQDRPIYLCQYIIASGARTIQAWDFSTSFENDFVLTTCDKKEIHLRPKPLGQYYQSFPGYGLDDLYRLHLDAGKYLIEQGGAELKKPPIDFEEESINASKRIKRWNWKHWYWTFAIPYFFFVRPRKWHNKTIVQQHELKMIQLPNEMLINASARY